LDDNRIIIVEGSSDKQILKKVLDEPIEIICTYGTFGIEKFDHMLEKYFLDDRDVFIFVDADEPGMELRKQLTQELPHAVQLYIPDEYVEVETTPEDVLASILLKAHFKIKPIYLMY